MKIRFRITALFLSLCILILGCGCGSKNEKVEKKPPTVSENSSDNSVSDSSSENQDTDYNSSEDASDFDFNVDDIISIDDDFNLGDDDFNLESYATVVFSSSVAQSNISGISGNFPVYIYFPDDTIGDGGFTDEEINLTIKRVVDSGVDIVRAYGVMPGQSTSEDGLTWDWDSTYMKAFYRYAEAMKENGIDIILNPNHAIGSNDPANNLPGLKRMHDATGRSYEELFAEWCVEYVKEVVIKRGYSNIKYLMYGTEVNNGSGLTKEKNLKDAKSWLNYVLKADEAMKAAGVRNYWKFVGPNIVCGPLTYDNVETINLIKAAGKVWIDYILENGDYAIDIYSMHVYYNENVSGGMGQDSFASIYKEFYTFYKSLVAKTGKPLWVDEWNVSSDKRNTEAHYNPLRGYEIALALVAQLNYGIDTAPIWFLVDTKWPGSTKNAEGDFDEGVMKMGVIPSVLQSTTPYPAFYSFALIASAVQPGDTVYGMTDESGWIHSVLLKHKDGKYSIVAINASYDTTNITYKLPWNLNGSFERSVYDPFTHTPTPDGTTIKPSSTVKITDSFTDKLMAYQVVVYNQK